MTILPNAVLHLGHSHLQLLNSVQSSLKQRKKMFNVLTQNSFKNNAATTGTVLAW
jgi:hypothetical protein